MTITENLRTFITTEALKTGIPDNFDDDYNLIDSGIMDSLFMMNLVTFIEQQYQISFGMNEMIPKNFQSINALAAFIASKQ